ncbi:hypothetical protein AB6C40_24215 [Vibrio splendidus]
MNNIIDYVKSHVVLDSYSSSTNFKGFCFSDIGWNDEKYIRILLNIIELLVSRLKLVSSLNIGLNLDEHTQEYSVTQECEVCRNSLIEAGIITNIKGDVPSDVFHFSGEVDADIALNLIRYQTSIGGAFGHAFFVDSKNGVILYPHDDCGLGFIIMGGVESQNQKLNTLKEIDLKYKNIMSFEFWKG